MGLLAWAVLLGYVSIPWIVSRGLLWDGGISLLGSGPGGCPPRGRARGDPSGTVGSPAGAVDGRGRAVRERRGAAHAGGSVFGPAAPAAGASPLLVLAIPAGMVALYALILIILLRAGGEFTQCHLRRLDGGVNDGLRRGLLAIGVTYLAFAGYILGRFANAAFPTFYLYRPLLLVIPLAIVIGLVAAWLARSHAPLAAGAGSGRALLLGDLLAALVAGRACWASAWVVLVLVVRRFGRPMPLIPQAASTATTAFALVFFVAGVARAVLHRGRAGLPRHRNWDRHRSKHLHRAARRLPAPRHADERHGDRQRPVRGALSARGFDVYDDAHTDRRYTDLTLMTLLTGTTEGVPVDTAPASQVQWLIRRALSDARAAAAGRRRAGYEWDVIDSPAGHVTFSAGHHIQHGGRQHLRGQHAGRVGIGPIVKAFLPYLLTDSLRAHFEGSVESLISLVDPRRASARAGPPVPAAPAIPVGGRWKADQGPVLLAEGEHLRGADRDDGDVAGRLLGLDEGGPGDAQPEAAGDGRRDRGARPGRGDRPLQRPRLALQPRPQDDRVVPLLPGGADSRTTRTCSPPIPSRRRSCAPSSRST